MSWNDGYFTDIDYSCRYHYNLSPANLELCLLFTIKEFSTSEKPRRYLELGFGHGFSLNIHAAASDGEFWGVDFNPDFALMANDLAKASGANIHICDGSFQEFTQRQDLPEFDIIVMHGVWSWISKDNQKIIVDFVRRKLAVGGAFYVSYNTPADKWTRLIPVRNLMKLYYDRVATQLDNSTLRVKNAIEFVSRIIAGNPNLPQRQQLIEEIDYIKNGNVGYIAGEYLGDHWDLIPFSEMSTILSEAKLNFAAHAELLENVDLLYLADTSRRCLSDMADPILKEMTRDFLSSHNFRSDIWLKGSRTLSMIERTQLLSDLKFILVISLEDVNLIVNVPAGEMTLKAEIYKPVLECLAENNHAAKSADELVNYHQLRGLNKGQILDALITLTSLHCVYPVQKDEMIEKVKSKTNALNAYLLEQSVHVAHINHLVSPVTGGGIEVSRIQQLFLLARLEDVSSPDEWASLTWQLISQQAQVTMIEGNKINSSTEGVALLKKMAHEFADKTLPILKTLGIAE